MAQPANICNHSGCYCKGYTIPTSKWSKGKCKSCNHSQKEHGEIRADVSYEKEDAAPAPQQGNVGPYNAQIDSKMGIVPSGKTNYKDVSGGSSGYQGYKREASIYSIHLDESDWINWTCDELLIWFQQKKRFPESLKVKSIEHEMINNLINGNKITQLTHSTMLSVGFTEYDHRQRLLAEVKKLSEKFPSSEQIQKYPSSEQKEQKQQSQQNEKNQVKEKDNKAESDLLKEKNLNESEWKTWTTDQVWEWLKIKQGWINTDEMEYIFVHKLNEFEQKLKSQDIKLTGEKFVEVKNDIKIQKILKAIGFPFSMRKAVYKHIDVLIRHNQIDQ